MTEEKEHLLSITEAAKYLKISYITMYRMVKKGEVPAQRVGFQWRIHPSALHRDIELHQDKNEDSRPLPKETTQHAPHT